MQLTRHMGRLLLAAAISALTLGLMFGLISQGGASASGARLLEVLSNSCPFLALAYALCTLGQTMFRARRYGVLLTAAGENLVPGMKHLFPVTLARNMFVDLLPARLGELSYLALLNRGYNVAGTSCVSSFSISFLFDFVALLFIILLIATGHLLAGHAEWWMFVAALILAVGVAVALFLVFAGFSWLLVRIHRVIPSPRAGGRVAGLLGFMDELNHNLAATRESGIGLRILLLSMGVRVFKYLGFYAMFLSVTRANYPDMAAALPWKVLASLIGAEAASSLPVPSFMSFGAYEAGGVAAWTLLGFAAADAALVMLAVHIGSQVIDYTFGGLGLLSLTWLAPGRAAGARTVTRAPGWRRLFYLGLLAVAVLCASTYLFKEYRGFGKLGAIQAPPAGREVRVAPDEIMAVQALAVSVTGSVVWSSNRTDNHDIWMMSLPDLAIRPLTTNSHAEFYPRFSPDGRRLAFSRSLSPWVSQRNNRDWSVWMLDLESGVETLVATNARTATWSGPDTLVYQLHETRVVEQDLVSGKVQDLVEAGEGGVPGGVVMETPSYSRARGQVAVTFRGAQRMTALVDMEGQVRKVGGGCQLFWSPDNSFLYFADHGGRMKNAFFNIDPVTLEKTLWFDDPGEFSHEYFPKISNDGRWLVYGACAEGHEHDTADYEIFLWRIGDDPEKRVRLTHHTGNDNWPDIFVK